MSTFDLAEVRRFTTDLHVRLDQCDNGEGMECANLYGTLRHYAELCCKFYVEVRQWGRAIFYGQAAFDPEVEKLWRQQGAELYRRASELWELGQEMHGECFTLEGGAPLGSALWRLERLMTSWVTPKLAAAPLARHGVALTPSANEEAKKRVADLPPLPADWQPADPRRRSLFRRLVAQRKPGAQ